MLNFGQVYASVGRAVPADRPAIIQGDKILSWQQLHLRTDALAGAFFAAGAQSGDKVAHLMRNSAAYLETTIAAFKARMVHVNINYRYTGDELFYILENSDAAVLVFDAEFAELVATLAPRLPKLKLILQTGKQAIDKAQNYEFAISTSHRLLPQEYSPDDLMFIYTGGTTGMPKGVMWAQGDMWNLLGGGAPLLSTEGPLSLDALCENAATGVGINRLLVTPPLMHGTGFLSAIYTLAKGGTIVLLPGGGFDPLAVLACCAETAPDYAVIVGDVFARPLLAGLDAGHGNIDSLRFMGSSGTMWSTEVKAGLLRHNPLLMILDMLASSESVGMGAAVQTAANAGEATRFIHDENTVVLDEELKLVAPGSGVMGRIARGGLIPRGYWKDPVKSAATFISVGDKRYAIAGDWATVDNDGAMILLGRGSQCINSGGEKIFPEEVEEALKTHASVDDALVFGVADEKWGQRIVAVVEGHAPDSVTLIAHVRGQLAAYKAPKEVHVVAKVPRAANGKADYAAAREMAVERGR